MSKFNFINILLSSKADISEVMENFNRIELNGVTTQDLTKVIDITILSSQWIDTGDGFEYKINNPAIQVDPYIIDIIFNDLSLIKAPINPKANSQATGSVVITTRTKPDIDLGAKLIITKGVQ